MVSKIEVERVAKTGFMRRLLALLRAKKKMGWRRDGACG
jgi:hypothetical protein